MTEETKKLYRVIKEFQIQSVVWMAAPYSEGEKIVLPVGMILEVYERTSNIGKPLYEAIPVNSKEWAPFLFSASVRFNSKFRGDYNFFPSRRELDENCEPVDVLPEEIPDPVRRLRSLQGCLFGTAVGDAIGLPYEGLSPARIKKLNAFPLHYNFLFGRGMISDDTEHTCMVAQALINSGGNKQRFSRSLAWKFRWWLLGLPAGIGLATLRACIKLCLGFPAKWSGVFSAGNGPAMRSAIVGVFAGDNYQHLEDLVRINTVITHRDPKALKGALIVAELAAMNAKGSPLTVNNCLEKLNSIINDDSELREHLIAAVSSAADKQTAEDFCEQQGWVKGVGGYMYHTLPVVLQIVLRHPDNYEAAITEAVACGGDTDTVSAIIGGIVGAGVGQAGIPAEWMTGLKDWPRDKVFIRLLGEELAILQTSGKPGITLSMDLIRVWLRNIFFMVWVLGHGFRRLLPPY